MESCQTQNMEPFQVSNTAVNLRDFQLTHSTCFVLFNRDIWVKNYKKKYGRRRGS